MSLTHIAEAARRRTFAIISHPDAGKTTLTENILLAGGAIRAADHLFRWGGEEFLLVCADTDGETMARLCEKLRLRLEQAEWPTLSDLGRITASFGVASFPEQTSPHELLLAADSALYRAKRAGRNRVESAR